ncbi:hypothetical protein D9M73_276650 [compost metagenome]
MFEHALSPVLNFSRAILVRTNVLAILVPHYSIAARAGIALIHFRRISLPSCAGAAGVTDLCAFTIPAALKLPRFFYTGLPWLNGHYAG